MNKINDLFILLETSYSSRLNKLIQESSQWGITEDFFDNGYDFKKKKSVLLNSSDTLHIPTLDGGVREVKGMLLQRFLFADRITDLGNVLLGLEDIEKTIKRPKFKKTIKSLQDNWESSAPQLFSMNNLSIFSVDSLEDFIFSLIVWNKEEEPELWTYNGQSEMIFANLQLWLEWYINP